MSYTEEIYARVVEQNPGEVEFHQAVKEVLGSLKVVIDANEEKYRSLGLLERLVEPERIISFKVPWVDDEGSVTVTNHSNAEVAVTVSFADADNGTASVDVANGTFTLESAVDKATNAADSETATLTASGIPESNAKIGTVTVAIAAN